MWNFAALNLASKTISEDCHEKEESIDAYSCRTNFFERTLNSRVSQKGINIKICQDITENV